MIYSRLRCFASDPPFAIVITLRSVSLNTIIQHNSCDQGSPIGGGGGTPYPPGEGRKNLRKWLNQGFFQIFFGLSYSEWSEWYKNGIFFRCSVFGWPARPPPKFTPLPWPPLEFGPLANPAIYVYVRDGQGSSSLGQHTINLAFHRGGIAKVYLLPIPSVNRP